MPWRELGGAMVTAAMPYLLRYLAQRFPVQPQAPALALVDPQRPDATP